MNDFKQNTTQLWMQKADVTSDSRSTLDRNVTGEWKQLVITFSSFVNFHSTQIMNLSQNTAKQSAIWQTFAMD